MDFVVGVMRGTFKLLTLLGLAAGFSVVPAVGSQGAGALGARQGKVDAELIPGDTATIAAADALVERAVLKVVNR